MKTVTVIPSTVLRTCLIVCLGVVITGCENASYRISLTEEINALRQEKEQLTGQLELSKSKVKQLKSQLTSLSGLESAARLENLYRLQRIEISRYTNFYDKDKDGKAEKLIVYIQPIDRQGDIVKATGAVEVQLWDLNKADGQALLGQWYIKPDELKKLWFDTLLTTNYRLTFDAADKIDDLESISDKLVVKVTFTDYLTGRVFKEQRIIKPY